MAKKGQKLKKYPASIKRDVVSKTIEERGYKRIGNNYPDIPVHAIQNWLGKANNNIDMSKDNRGSSGRQTTKNLT